LEALGVALVLPVLGRVSPGRHLILAYHNVVPDDHVVGGEPSIHLSLSAFRRQLDLLTETHRLVPLDRILGVGVVGTRDRLASVTFDDAYRGALELALPELLSRGLPATVFVAPRLLGAPAFWWDALCSGGATALDDETREHALDTLAGDGGEIQMWARETGRSLEVSFEWERPGTLDELQRVAHHPMVTLGPHSWSHPNLTRLDDTRLAEEVERPLAWLRENFAACVVPIFAYPYGLSSRTVEDAVRRAGYEAGLRVEGGLVPPRIADPFLLPRVNVPAGLSPSGFKLRVAGLLAG
jgi:peptidoglycan/xylan/chitin deacetylase (PgdA/CDA1 family)